MACEAARLCRGNGLALRRRAMRVLSYLRMEIDPGQIDAYEEDLEEMIQLARKTTGLLGVESFRARGEPNVYLVLSEWESHEAMRSWWRASFSSSRSATARRSSRTASLSLSSDIEIRPSACWSR